MLKAYLTPTWQMILCLFTLALTVGLAHAIDLKSWDEQINDKSRFVVLKQFDKNAVLDKETGLVWEKIPDITARHWGNAHFHCNQRIVGNRAGWRLPAVEELSSLLDISQLNPTLPKGHPFDVQLDKYFASTTHPASPNIAWHVNFANGEIENTFKSETALALAWCVRGGRGHDGFGTPF